MTAKRGSLWKTSWRKQKPALGAGTELMWFFCRFSGNEGTAHYEQADATPSTGAGALPFWFGSIQATSGPPGFALTSEFGRDSAWKAKLTWDNDLLRPSAEVEPDIGVAVEVPVYNAPLSRFQVRAVVQLVTVEPVDTGFRYVFWVDGSPVAERTSTDPYMSGVGQFMILPQDGFVNSVVGGNALPTDEEIRAWFTATRQALSAQPIAGKTQDRYDAGTVPGTVPATLTNLAGGQDADLIITGASPINFELRAVFGY